MEKYIVSARKYRPQTFETVVGQQALTQTLQNAIRQNHLAHAYLFCGSRGVGKTTCARIFAKTINCLTPQNELDACNTCESCKAFNEQRSFNIHELDAASNNSVEDIRSLIEQVRIPPQIGKYSVYIIDEVHMLSTGAFNALLKTLEEPPSYAIFILATTEKHKVPTTILSRCQVYDFNRITVPDIIASLQRVAEQEQVTVSEEALNVVAQKADGGMRDALSIFDQLVAFCDKDISYERTIQVLNVLDSDYYFQLVEHALQHDVAAALMLFNDVLTHGFDAAQFVTGFAQHLRDVLVAKDPQTVVLLETSDAIRQRYIQQAQKCHPLWLFQALDILNTCDINYRTARNKRLTVELSLVKLTQLGVKNQEPPAPQKAPATSQNKNETPGQNKNETPSQSKNETPSQSNPQASTQPTKEKGIKLQMPEEKKTTSVPVLDIDPKALEHLEMPEVGGNKPVQTPSTTPPQSVVTETPKEEQKRPFTDSQLRDAWVGLASEFENNTRLKDLMDIYAPHKLDDTHIEIAMPNPWQMDEMRKALLIITRRLRAILHNDELEIRLVMEEFVPGTFAFTADEVYQVMSKDYPMVTVLREKLKLQID